MACYSAAKVTLNMQQTTQNLLLFEGQAGHGHAHFAGDVTLASCISTSGWLSNAGWGVRSTDNRTERICVDSGNYNPNRRYSLYGSGKCRTRVGDSESLDTSGQASAAPLIEKPKSTGYGATLDINRLYSLVDREL